MSILVRNLQLLKTEIFKAKFDLSPSFMKDIFMERCTTQNLRHGNDAQLPKVRSTSFGVDENIAYLLNKLWQLLPHEIKLPNTSFIPTKNELHWNGDECNCRNVYPKSRVLSIIIFLYFYLVITMCIYVYIAKKYRNIYM